MRSHLTFRRWTTINALLVVLLAAALATSLAVGSGDISLQRLLDGDPIAHAILFTSRLPRALLAALVGLALASSGASFQALLRNPLADPFILGVSGGAALGAVAAVCLGLPFAWQSAVAFAAAALAIVAIFWMAAARGSASPTTLLLAGVIFNAFCFALILFVNAIVTMEQSYQILFLLIGALEAPRLAMLAILACFVLTGFLALCACSLRMNALALGDDEAATMGVHVSRLRAIVFAAASCMVGAAVAASGLIGFVGLFIPHIVRMLFGPDHRLLIPASGLAGAAFLVAADATARTLLMETSYATELPVGVITALVGAPMFLVVLRRQHMRT
jgi:ABC-type Fe3+-siderophore transport system permease subunit